MKKYDRDFKIQTVELVISKEKTVAQLSRELEISENTLYRWVSEYKEDPKNAFRGKGQLKPEDKSTLELQKQIRDLEEENNILKKAMHIFAKDRK